MGIARLLKSITETVYIPEDTVDRYVPHLSPECRPLQEADFLLLGITDATKGYSVERRRPEFHELLFCLEGQGQIRADGISLNIVPGDLLIVPRNTTYVYECTQESWRLMWFHLADRGTWRSLCSLPIQVRSNEIPAYLELAMNLLLSESVGSSLHRDHIITLLAELVVLYLERELAVSDSARERTARAALQDMWDGVSGRLDKDWTIRSLAAKAHMSASSFYRTCERYMGQNPKEILVQLRIRRAEELLMNYGYPVKAVAAMVGYKSPFSFSNAFKRVKRISPKAYQARAGIGKKDKRS